LTLFVVPVRSVIEGVAERPSNTQMQSARTVVQSPVYTILTAPTRASLGLNKFRRRFEDAWFWRLKAHRQEPWTATAIKKIVWNDSAKSHISSSISGGRHC
jgi:hypothetical protein